MARIFTSEEARQLISRHQCIIDRLRYAAGRIEHASADIAQAADNMVSERQLDILRTVPTEEINRDRLGIRVKTLRDNGYRSAAELLLASHEELAALNGISDSGASVIKNTVSVMAEQAAAGIKIRLSPDSRSPASDELVKALYSLRLSLPFAGKCTELLDFIKSSGLEEAMYDLKPGRSLLRWIFSSELSRLRAGDAYSFLSDVISSEYSQRAEEVFSLMRRLESLSAEEAWRDFGDNSIEYYNILEKLRPGLTGPEDSTYGLPEELAAGIREESYSLDGLLCTLRKYQEWGVKYALHQRRILLGDEMGLGKTVEAIAVMVALRNAGKTHFLVVCPAGLLANWCREIKKHSLLKVFKIHGDRKEAALEQWLNEGGAAVTSYEATNSIYFRDSFHPALIVADEAHYIKNPAARRSKNVTRLCGSAERLLFMTGTALENNVDEMIALISILQPRTADSVRGMEALSSAPLFRQKIASVYFRRRREDVLTELPELIESREWCSLLPREEALYEQAVLNRDYAFARRVSWYMPELSESSKARRMMEIIEDAEEDGRRVIVFSFFLDTLDKISGYLNNRCAGLINGSVSSQRRQELIDEFNTSPPGSVLCCQIQSGGTGLNIQSASIVIICEPQLKPSAENQAISRAYRMGQTRNVLVYRLLCEDTVDEGITEMLERKQAVFDRFADKSAAADENFGIDSESFESIMRDELERINLKRSAGTSAC